MKQKAIISLVWLVILGLVVWGFVVLLDKESEVEVVEEPAEEVVVVPTQTQEVIGLSVEGRQIEVYTFGTGERDVLFVGGIHGGYEWNSVLLAYAFIDYFKTNPNNVPKDTTISIIPSLNPDGVYKIIAKEGRFALTDVPEGVDMSIGRFNANGVDLNRNFDCKWAPESTWRGEVVSAGTGAFSEPEAIALRDYVLKTQPEFVALWHSKANAVYASECEEGVLPETLEVMSTYATAASYAAIPVFDAYPITGDAEGWLASIGIPAVTVELETRDSIEWERNLLGVQALIERKDEVGVGQ